MSQADFHDVPISNWTLATGTKPGERHVSPIPAPKGMRHPESRRGSKRQPRTAVAITRHGAPSDWLDLLPVAAHFDTVYIEAATQASAVIRRVRPDAIVVCLDFEDPADFQLLSMLHAEQTARGISMIAYLMPRQRPQLVDSTAERERDSSRPSPALRSLN